MNLLKIGRWYINLDMVRYVQEDSTVDIRIFFSEENRGGEILQLKGEEATAMSKWLRLNSTEVNPPVKDWRTS